MAFNSGSARFRRLAPLFIVMAAIFWGFLFVFVRRFGGYGFSSLEIVALRCTGSVLWLGAYALIFERPAHSADGSPALQLKKRDLWCFLGSGLVSIVFFSYCFFRNAAISTAAVAAVLMYTSPAFVLLFSRLFFHECITPRKALALLAAIVGTVFISGIIPSLLSGGTAFSWAGLLLGLGSGIGYALYSIFGSFALRRGYRPMVVTLWTFVFAAIGSLALIDIPQLFSRLSGSPGLVSLWLAMGLFGSCLPFSLYTLGLSSMEPGRAAVLATLEPIVTALAGLFLYQEVISPFETIGIILILSASLTITR